MHVPSALCAVPLIAGCAYGLLRFDNEPDTFVALVCAAAGAIALLAAAAAWLDEAPVETNIGLALGACLVGVSLGTSAAREIYQPSLLLWFHRTAPSDSVEIEAVLREDAAVSPFGVSLSLNRITIIGRSARLSVTGGARISVAGDLAAHHVAKWRAGRAIRAPVFFRLPAVYRNPGVADDSRALARRGISLVGSVKSASLVDVVRRGSAIDEMCASIRAWTRARLASLIGRRSPRSAAIATAILIGDRTGLAADDERRLQKAGTYHVIAISGGNIAILTVVLLLALRLLHVPGSAAAAAAIAILILYYQVAGHAASVGRAVTAAVIFLAARLLDHRGSPLNALANAAVLVLAAAPAAVLDPGFILSFGATLAILLGAPRMLPPAGRVDGAVRRSIAGIGRGLTAMLVATTCAEIALAPASATLFSRVTFAGLVLNFAAIPMMTLVQLGGLAALTLSWASFAAPDWCAGIAHVAASGLVESSRLVEYAPWLFVDVRPPAWWLVCAYYVAAAGMLIAPTRRLAAVVLAGAATLLLTDPDVTTRDHVPRPPMPLRVVALDVGQGDATVVQLRDGRALLVDAGGLAPLRATEGEEPPSVTFDIGDRVVRPALDALGISELEALVITHGDADHLQGARGLLERIGTRSVWEGVPVPPHAGLRALASAISNRHATWRTLQAGDRERFGEVEVRVLHPPLPEWERQRVRNEDSVVLELRIGEVSIVLPGDIGREGEAAVQRWVQPGRVVVLKAPHHGSATSSSPALLDALRPAAVIFSAGRDNRFGHPHPAVVTRYRSRGTTMFSTAEDGAVFVETDGHEVRVRGWLGREASFDVRSQAR
jgi:competence protein ComEC